LDHLHGRDNVAAMSHARPVGDHLREWRQRRRMSQLDLALDAEISTRHLSFLETGRSQPSRDMLLRLAERLEVPLRERNLLLVAAGFAPLFQERPLSDPLLHPAREAVERLLAAHQPYPAVAIDRHWTLIAANASAQRLMAGVDASLLQPPVNVLRVSLHPEGMAPMIANYAEWRAHLLLRLRRQIDVSADQVLTDLLAELSAYPPPVAGRPAPKLTREQEAASGVVVPMRLTTENGVLSFLSTTTVFGTPVDITLSELALEAFFPADTATADALRKMA
jgi:transcriptional regulator with XRE-family HTH domain